MKASLTWKIRQGREWLSTSLVLPAESGARVAVTLLREFGEKRYTPQDVDVTGEAFKRFSYHSDRMVLLLRRIKGE